MLGVPTPVVDELRARLKRLPPRLPQYSAEPMPVTLLYAHRRHVPQRVQAFMAWLAETVRPYLDA